MPDGALVLEPTGLEVCIAHKGFVWFEVTARGRAAHGSRPDLGVDANLALGRYLAALDGLRAELADGPAHPLLGPASLHVGRMEGGSAPSVYAAESRAVVEWRTLPGDDPDACLARLRALAERTADPRTGFDGTVETVLRRPPFETSARAPLVRTLREVLAGRGLPAEVRGEGPWMDAALLAEAGADTAVVGPAAGSPRTGRAWRRGSSGCAGRR